MVIAQTTQKLLITTGNDGVIKIWKQMIWNRWESKAIGPEGNWHLEPLEIQQLKPGTWNPEPLNVFGTWNPELRTSKILEPPGTWNLNHNEEDL